MKIIVCIKILTNELKKNLQEGGAGRLESMGVTGSPRLERRHEKILCLP